MEQGNGLPNLGNQKALSFSSDGGAQAAWKSSITLMEPSAGCGSSAASGDEGAEEKRSTSGLKEHDYIGLAKVSSSVKPLHDTHSPTELSFPETDLHLGLGLGLGPARKGSSTEESEKTLDFTLTQKEGVPKVAMETPRYAFTEAAQASQKPWPNVGPMRPSNAENLNHAATLTSARDFQAPKVCMLVQDYGEGTSRVGGNSFYGGHPSALKNGTKRGYTEAMNEAAVFNVATEGRGVVAPATSKNGDGDAKVLPKHQQGAFMPNWVPSKPAVPAHWQVGHEQSSVHFAPNKPSPCMALPRGEKPAADRGLGAYKPHDSSEAEKEPATNEPPPPKGQVVGWPPIPSYRKHTSAKPTEMFVKVNMDGMTVGRKVDLNAHNSYEGLLLALEEMFQPSNNTGGQGTSQAASGRENHINDVKQLRLLNGSDFVLTYEDQDGDWMLVGDVPWSMFSTMVRRLRITRGSEATGLAPRRPEKVK